MSVLGSSISEGEIRQSLKRVEKWVEDHDYKGYEPFDGLSSVLRPLTFKKLLLDRVLMQLVRQSPVNLRPVMGIKPLDSTIGRGYMAWGYLTMLKVTGDEMYAQKARKCLRWLMENRSPGYEEYSWGKHFDFASRAGYYPKFEPITVWTSLIGLAFLDAFEILAEEIYLRVAESICRWISSLSINQTTTGKCLSYTGSANGGSTIHNHNMLAAAVLARTGKHMSNSAFLALAESAIEYSCSRQLPSGAWYYGEEPMYEWIDNFHTGYNLDALRAYIDCTRDRHWDESLQKGLAFYKEHFFQDNKIPKYYHDQTRPIDSQCISQSIDTLANFANRDSGALSLAFEVAGWAIANMQDRDGHFYYRRYNIGKMNTPMLHWGQATMYKALASLLWRAGYQSQP